MKSRGHVHANGPNGDANARDREPRLRSANGRSRSIVSCGVRSETFEIGIAHAHRNYVDGHAVAATMVKRMRKP